MFGASAHLSRQLVEASTARLAAGQLNVLEQWAPARSCVLPTVRSGTFVHVTPSMRVQCKTRWCNAGPIGSRAVQPYDRPTTLGRLGRHNLHRSFIPPSWMCAWELEYRCQEGAQGAQGLSSSASGVLLVLAPKHKLPHAEHEASLNPGFYGRLLAALSLLVSGVSCGCTHGMRRRARGCLCTCSRGSC